MMINEAGGKAVGLTGKDGCLMQVHKKLLPDQDNPDKMIDIGFVGEITRIEPAAVRSLQAGGFIPLTSSIGYREDGKAYHIHAAVEAGHIGAVPGARRLDVS